MIDFTKLEVGTKVWDFGKGWGTIKSIGKHTIYPIEVTFEDFDDSTYTLEGKCFKDQINPRLFLSELKIPEENLRHPLKTDDLVLVRDHEKDDWVKRHFYGFANGGILVFMYGKTSWTIENHEDYVRYNCWKLPEVEDEKN